MMLLFEETARAARNDLAHQDLFVWKVLVELRLASSTGGSDIIERCVATPRSYMRSSAAARIRALVAAPRDVRRGWGGPSPVLDTASGTPQLLLRGKWTKGSPMVAREPSEPRHIRRASHAATIHTGPGRPFLLGDRSRPRAAGEEVSRVLGKAVCLPRHYCMGGRPGLEGWESGEATQETPGLGGRSPAGGGSARLAMRGPGRRDGSDPPAPSSHLGFREPITSTKLFGRAVTVSFFPACTELLDPRIYTFGRLFDEAMRSAAADPAHTVLVLSSNGYPDVSLAGGTKLSRLSDQGFAGVLTDGRLRDFNELASESFSTWCSGEAVGWGGGEVTPYLANVPVVLGGVGVHPGQYIFCDSAGAVVISEADIDGVLDVAHQIRSEDVAFRVAIATKVVTTCANDEHGLRTAWRPHELTSRRCGWTPRPIRRLMALARAGADAFGYTATLRVDASLAQLLRLRVAQLNSCVYCLSVHYAAAEDIRSLR